MTGAAGLEAKPYSKRCNFGRGHVWIGKSLPKEVMPLRESFQCATCGAVDSETTKGLK